MRFIAGDRPRADQKHMQSLVAQFQAQLLAERGQGEFAGRIGPQPASRALGRQRADVDHMAPPGQKVRERRLGQAHHGQEIELD